MTTGQSPQFLLNSMGQIVGQANSLGQVIGQAGTTALGQVNSLGQVVGQTNAVGQVISQTAGTIVGQAAPAAQSQPFLIQQPGGNQILVMRPQAPAIQQQPVPTILQPAMTAGTPGMIATAAAANGQNNAIFMQPPTPTGAITAQPSVS